MEEKAAENWLKHAAILRSFDLYSMHGCSAAAPLLFEPQLTQEIQLQVGL